MDEILVRGARVHNLQNLTVAIPRGKLVVITGPSGSGKSSLAFDTLYAEAQRRFVESLSAHARHYLGQLPKPDVDAIEGLSPAISVRQEGASRSPRSTVGTLTEIYDYLRLLFARVGLPHSPRTGSPMRAFTVPDIVDRVLALPEDARVTIRAPLARGAVGGFERELAALRKEGFVRVEVDGTLHDLGEDVRLDPERAHDIEVHIDRIKVKPAARSRVSEAVELSLRKGAGFVRVVADGGYDATFCEQLVCPDTGESFGALTPRTFSFNSVEGACRGCDGLGSVHDFAPDLIIPDESLSLRDGAIAAWGPRDGVFYQEQLEALRKALAVDVARPVAELEPALLEAILRGGSGKAKYEGVIPGLARRAAELERRRGAPELAETLALLETETHRFAREMPCPACGGARLGLLGRGVTVGGRTLPSLSSVPLPEALAFFEALELPSQQQGMAARILHDVRERLRTLLDLGLDYLSLDRAIVTLSGGELERIRLAAQIGSALVGVLYVLDEPSAGLHAHDGERLLRSLCRLRDQGSSLVVVEHDEALMRAADHILDLGPGAGAQGGRLVAQGSPAALAADERSVTGSYLAGRDRVVRERARRKPRGSLRIEGVHLHNLRGVSVSFPLGVLTCVSGVSGSGKSSLVLEALLPSLRALLRKKGPPPPFTLRGAEGIERVIEVDQAPIGRTPRSSPISYVGAFDDLRELFASLPEARARGYGAARFSFNVKGGRCESCRGDGLLRVDMQFLPDELVVCERCEGQRYERETLEVRYRGYSIADVLALSVDRAVELLSSIPKLRGRLEVLQQVGLGYLALGQPATTLSGGEAQRVKLARELSRRGAGKSLFVLDEPTSGLHFGDVALLVSLLDRLVDAGHTVLVIEHHLDVLAAADHLIDMGPGAGPQGGRVVAEGTPEQLAHISASATAPFLARKLGLF